MLALYTDLTGYLSEKVLTSLTTILLQAALKRFKKFKRPESFKKKI
jgi:hypothetical protein